MWPLSMYYMSFYEGAAKYLMYDYFSNNHVIKMYYYALNFCSNRHSNNLRQNQKIVWKKALQLILSDFTTVWHKQHHSYTLYMKKKLLKFCICCPELQSERYESLVMTYFSSHNALANTIWSSSAKVFLSKCNFILFHNWSNHLISATFYGDQGKIFTTHAQMLKTVNMRTFFFSFYD